MGSVVSLIVSAIWHTESKTCRPEQPAEHNPVKVTQRDLQPVSGDFQTRINKVWCWVQAALALPATKITHYGEKNRYKDTRVSSPVVPETWVWKECAGEETAISLAVACVWSECQRMRSHTPQLSERKWQQTDRQTDAQHTDELLIEKHTSDAWTPVRGEKTIATVLFRALQHIV